MEVWEEVPPPPPPPADDNTTAADGKDGGDGKDGNKKDGKDAPAPAPAEPPQLRKRVLRVPLNLTGGFVAPGMNKTELDASRRVMRRLRAADNAKRETAKARNDLEAYVIATLDKVGCEGPLALWPWVQGGTAGRQACVAEEAPSTMHALRRPALTLRRALSLTHPPAPCITPGV